MLNNKYRTLNDRFSEEYNLVVGMRYGHCGIQPCHQGCSGICASSSGNSVCGAYLGSVPIEIDGTSFYIIVCNESVMCGSHNS